ncbi:MAG: ABC transporter permease, partial [Acidimicrobiia bacterium]
ASEHLALSGVSTLLAVSVGIPVGVMASRRRLGFSAGPLLGLANVGQALPTVAVLALMFTVTGLGFRTAVAALFLYSLLPVLANTLVGIRSVDPSLVEAARATGMRPLQVLWRVELPVALPILLAGVRTAAVLNVGTAALATFAGAGGLGAIVEVGINNQRDRLLYVGSSLTALLALAVEWAIGLVGRIVCVAAGVRGARIPGQRPFDQ